MVPTSFKAIALLSIVGALGVGLSQKSKPSVAAGAEQSVAPIKAASQPSGDSAHLIGQFSPSQQDFWRSCSSVFNSSIVFSAMGFDKGQMCVCMVETLERSGAHRDKSKLYALASDAMALTVAKALEGAKASEREIRDILLQRHKGMKGEATWIQGALFHSFARCAEKDERSASRIDAVRSLLSRR